MVAERIAGVLPEIIHEDQCGFVAGRYIGEAVRNTMDVMDWLKRTNREGLLLLIDFKKAFDSISFKIMDQALELFGFGNYIREWIWILLTNFKASINHGGHISIEFNIDRGCRQGDPIASLLFILVIEIMCIKIRATNKVKGIKIGKHIAKLSMYADDSTIFLENNETEL